jgi:hypothetical protein
MLVFAGMTGLRPPVRHPLGRLVYPRVGLMEKPSKTHLWGIIGVLIAAYATGLAGLAVLR